MRKTGELANAQANERRLLTKIRTADLVTVTAFHEGQMMVDMKPLVKREISGEYESPPPVLTVKVARIPLDIWVDGEKASVKVDIKPGDIGIVVYLDLDSDASLQSGRESVPNTRRIHSGDDGIFVGVIVPGY